MKANQRSRKTGLARTLSKIGYCSRSRAAELIRDGRVSVNEKIWRDPETPVFRNDRLAVDGNKVETLEKIYVMLNKPRGVVTTASDEKNRETVYELLSGCSSSGKGFSPWIAPVGRLDKASEGLLLFTNDSEWADSITAPESHLEKTYHVQVGRVLPKELLGALVRGVPTRGGEILKATQARLLRSGQKNCWVEVVLDEGKNRQIRRMFEALGIEVLRLVRVSIGPLFLGNLAKGESRALTAGEKQMLDGALRKKTP